MRLVTAMLASTFGHGNNHPVRAAYVRVGMLVAIAIGGGCMAARAVSTLPLMPLPEPARALPGIIVCSQVLLLSFLLTAQSIVGRPSSDVWHPWLETLPLTPRRRRSILLLPQLVLMLLAMTLFALPLLTLCGRLGIPITAFIGCFAIGSLSAWGLTRLGEWQPFGRWVGLLALFLYGEYAWLGVIANPLSTSSDVIVAQTCLYGGLSMASILAFHRRVHHDNSVGRLYFSGLASRWWLACKAVRTAGLRRSFGLTCCMSMGVAVLGHKLGLRDAAAYAGAAALLGAALCADVRTMSRRWHAPESYFLKGSHHFVHHMLTVSVASALTALSPLLWMMQEAGATASHYLLVMTGIIAGLCASIVLAPIPRDIRSQCCAVLMACGLLFGVPLLIPPTVTAPLAYGTITILLVVAAYHIEYLRNPYYWRKHAQNAYRTHLAASGQNE